MDANWLRLIIILSFNAGGIVIVILFVRRSLAAQRQRFAGDVARIDKTAGATTAELARVTRRVMRAEASARRVEARLAHLETTQAQQLALLTEIREDSRINKSVSQEIVRQLVLPRGLGNGPTLNIGALDAARDTQIGGTRFGDSATVQGPVAGGALQQREPNEPHTGNNQQGGPHGQAGV
jgi:hypothetical protein